MGNHYTPLFSSIRHSTKLAALPDDACRVFYLLLLAQCDAWGRADARPAVLFAEVWPLLGKSMEETERCRNELARVGLIQLLGPARANAGQAGPTRASPGHDGRNGADADGHG